MPMCQVSVRVFIALSFQGNNTFVLDLKQDIWLTFGLKSALVLQLFFSGLDFVFREVPSSGFHLIVIEYCPREERNMFCFYGFI